jgi:phospholipid transport system substrate-binding protein
MTPHSSKPSAMSRRLLLGAGVALMMQAPALGAALAGPDPAAFVDGFGHELHAVASNASPGERREGFRRLFDRNFDVPGLGRFVLGRFWRVLTPVEQQQFLCLFENYVVLAFSDERLSEYAAAGAVPRVTGTRADADGVVVSSRMTRGTAPPVEVDWRLEERGGAYKIADIVIGGLSLAANGRSELEGVVERNGGRAQSILAVLQQQMANYSAPSMAGRCSPAPGQYPRALASAQSSPNRAPGRE